MVSLFHRATINISVTDLHVDAAARRADVALTHYKHIHNTVHVTAV